MKGKWLITAMMASSLVASNAFATIARQAVLGGQPVFTSAGASASRSNAVNGALWYDDDYNVFYNPSYVMDNKNFAVIQKGTGAGGSGEGGFFKGEFENFAYGVYLNRGGATPEGAYGGGRFVAPGVAANAAYIGAAQATNTQRPIDLFFAGDTGIKWGVHVAWAYNRDQTVATSAKEGAEVTNRYWHFDFGAQIMGLEPFIGLTTMSKYQNDTGAALVDQDLNEFNVGARYKYEGWSPFAVFKKYRESGNSTNVAALAGRMAQARMTHIGVGVGHDTKVADGVHVMKAISYWSNSVEDDTAAAERNKDYRDQIVPINLTIEAEATSWLTLRAGATYDLFNERKHARSAAAPAPSVNDKVISQAGTTTFRVGSTFKFGKFALDSAFGNGAAADAGAPDLGNSSIGFDSQTFALVSASYRW